MPNKPPVCVLVVSPETLVWPENRVTLDLSSSYDPNRVGQISTYSFSCDDPDVIIENDRTQTITAILPQKGKVFSFVGKVTDRGGLSDSMTRTVTMKVKTVFGASGPTISSPEILKAIAGFPSVSRGQVILTLDSSDRETDEYTKAGVPFFLNCNYEPVRRDSAGNKIPNPFPTDLNKYASKLEPVLRYFQGNALVIPVCENEPTTSAFHSGPMSNYLSMLEVFTDLCIKYKLRPVDGGVHVATVLGADLTDDTGEGRAAQVAELLKGYKNIPLWKVNLHTSNIRSTYDYRDIPLAVNKILIETGHETISNEWHVQSKAGKYQATTDTLRSMMKGWLDAGVEYSVYISGTSDDNEALNVGSILTDYGKAYKAYIDAS